jgi:hypothetical protein
MAATFVTDFGTALALSLLFLQFNVYTLVFFVFSAILLLFGPKIITFFFRRYEKKVIEPEIKLLFFIFFLTMFIGELGKSHAVLPIFILGLLMSKFFEENHHLLKKLRTVGYALITPFFFIKGGMNVGLKEVLKKGVYAGYPVVDVKVVLLDGSYHEVDSSDIAFRLAAMGCFREGFMKSKPVLLEPYMLAEVISPNDYVSNLVAYLCSKRGKILNIDAKGQNKIITAEVPLSEMFGYAENFRSLSSGRATFSMQFLRYEQAPNEIIQKVLAEKEKNNTK